ncbi:MAG TPA: hypothetical protein VK939_02435, partial [Longimicrobiales bacterium]|nr:hypothetical protein [Longimicrobiales bacterium]
MPSRRKTALIAAGALALLLLLVALLPLLFRAPLERKLKAGINRSVDARVDWRRAGLTLFRDFPNLTLRLDELVVAGADRFAQDTLLSVGRTRVVLDLGSVLRSLRSEAAVVVRSIELVRPHARLIVLEDGTANWNIGRPSTDAEPGGDRPISVSLRRLEVHEGALRLENRQANLHV